ncbi:MAG: carboxylesterase family protein, partial [Ilumatobacteraceae bacterium]
MTEVVLADGRLVGDQRPDGTLSFLGVRFATAHRFGSAEPEKSWSGAREARRPGPICHQRPGLLA